MNAKVKSTKAEGYTRDLIINAIQGNNAITVPELAIIANITEQGVNYHLKRLKRKKVLKKLKSEEGDRWHIVYYPED